MRKRIAMVLLGLSLAVGTPAATNMFPTVSAQTVQAAGKTGWTQESGTWYFYKDGVKQTGWQTWDGKKYYLNADGTMKANEWMIDTDGGFPVGCKRWKMVSGERRKNCNGLADLGWK